MTSREMVQDSATRRMDLDPSTPEIESGYEFNRRSIEDDRAADDRNSISDQDIDSRL